MPTPLKRWLTPRFSLRAMLVVLTVGCVTLGWRANRLYQNQRAIDSLRKRGLIVQRFVWPARYHDLSFWTRVNVNEIVMWGAEAPDEAYPPAVSELWGDLSSLVPLNSIAINNATLPSRAKSKDWNRSCSATEVEFHSCKFHDDAFENAIEQMPRLKTLRLTSGTLDLTELSCLSQSGSIDSLDISMDAIPANIINSFGGKKFRRLEFSAITKDEDLGRIDLSAMDINAMLAMDQLEVLTISGVPGFPVARLPELEKLKKLRSLTLDLTNISDAELKAVEDELTKALPDCDLLLYRVPGH